MLFIMIMGVGEAVNKKSNKTKFSRRWLLMLLFVFLAWENMIFSLVAVLSLAMGIFVYVRPREVIEIQQKFYRLINWNMEPVSWEKEIRNTKIMGMGLIVFIVICCFYIYLVR